MHCIDKCTHDALGIRRDVEDVEWYLEALKLNYLMELSHPTYEKLMCEFLRTVTLAYPRTKAYEAKNMVFFLRHGWEPYVLDH